MTRMPTTSQHLATEVATARLCPLGGLLRQGRGRVRGGIPCPRSLPNVYQTDPVAPRPLDFEHAGKSNTWGYYGQGTLVGMMGPAKAPGQRSEATPPGTRLTCPALRASALIWHRIRSQKQRAFLCTAHSLPNPVVICASVHDDSRHHCVAEGHGRCRGWTLQGSKPRKPFCATASNYASWLWFRFLTEA